MTTINEDFVSFETAKLLKEKGFDKDWVGGSIEEYLNGTEGYSLPTLAATMKWLREVHNIDISIIPLRSQKEYLPRIESDTISHDAIPCKEYEKAAEVAIKYCLENLI